VRLVITGAPASGKSDCWQRLQTEPELADFVFFEELARQLLREDPSYRENKDRWHTEIYRRQTARENELSGQSFVTDRGTVDAFAFHPETAGLVGTSIEREYERYDRVVHLGSAARLGEPYYRTDTERLETIEEALVIETAIREIWQAHPGYHFIAASEDYEQKYATLVRTIRAWLGA